MDVVQVGVMVIAASVLTVGVISPLLPAPPKLSAPSSLGNGPADVTPFTPVEPATPIEAPLVVAVEEPPAPPPVVPVNPVAVEPTHGPSCEKREERHPDAACPPREGPSQAKREKHKEREVRDRDDERHGDDPREEPRAKDWRAAKSGGGKRGHK